jgi:membrane-associated phospholipid phosphatase
VADGFNTLGSPGVLVALNAGMIAVGYARESSGAPGGVKLKQTGLVGLEAELFAVAATLALKEITGRARPDEQKGTTHFRPFSGGGSFASNHAAASFAVASVLADRYEYGWLAYAPAAAVAVSRMYSREHFLSDVVAGSLIGWGMGTFLSRRHRLESDWHMQPAMTLDGSGMGLTLRKQF